MKKETKNVAKKYIKDRFEAWFNEYLNDIYEGIISEEIPFHNFVLSLSDDNCHYSFYIKHYLTIDFPPEIEKVIVEDYYYLKKGVFYLK